MFINEYNYLTPTKDCGDHLEVEDLSREDGISKQYIERFPAIKLTRPTAVLYSAGVTVHQSDGKNCNNVKSRYHGSVPYFDGSMMIKELSAYAMHQWIGSMKNNEEVVYASINGNSCASSMHSLYEAERLLNEGVCEEVIVITEEKTSFNTIRIFKEHGIKVTVADGAAVVRISMDPIGHEVTDTKWSYEYNRNPFGTSQEGYYNVATACDTVKPHGTNTDSNNVAEELLVSSKDAIYYKKDIGHTQGASALLELCMAIDDDNAKGKVLCVASGVGGFYGSCLLHKTS